MNKFVVAVFPSEAKAYEGTRAMRELQADGSLAIYGTAVVTKAVDGKLSVNDRADAGPAGTAIGVFLGGLLGLLGGASGAAVGLTAGGVLGSWRDLFNLGVDKDFLDKVSTQLTPGKSAVVAEVNEDWVTPLDTRIEALGGTVLRQARRDFEDEQIKQAATTDKAELADLEAEYRQARAEDQARLRVRIDAMRTTLRSRAAHAKERRDQLQREAEAKIAALREQRIASRADAKARHDKRLAEVRADYDRRMDKLAQAAELWVDAETLAP